jgi:hypothetical protein
VTADQPAPRNRLASETSPYLLQHAANPVDWYPWGEEAFARARTEDRPILLSVGYSSCHWCHVMAHESFEDEETAALMNGAFINIKVDREERPDVDSVYMTAVQALTGQGGWPMTVFMTPDGRPFYAGTYFPPDDAHGRPGFRRVLVSLEHAWQQDRENLLESAEKITEHLRLTATRDLGGELTLTPDLPVQAAAAFREAFDPGFGGFGGAPKFPAPSNLEFLLAHSARVLGDDQEDIEALGMVVHTLHAMATGGMYDQLGAGFARYSVDEAWVVPHFEKMLYDNAQLARVYLHAFQLTGNEFFERIAAETLDYLHAEMMSPEGGFYSATDADSEGIEGKFFVWSLGEVQRLLGKDAAIAAACFGVTGEGNFRDPHHPEFANRNVLTRRYNPAETAGRLGMSEDELEAKLDELRGRMFQERETRVRPGLDDKVLASWNGLALAAFAEAARVTGDEVYRRVAEENASFLRERMWRDGRLLHSYKGGEARIDGMLEDYAFVGLGLVEMYKLNGDLAHIEWARELMDILLARFRDPDRGGFFETASDAEQLLVRQKPTFDSATPSGNSAAAMLAVWLARYYGNRELEEIARETVAQVSDVLLQAPSGFGCAWQVVEFLLSPPRELVIVGEPAAREPLEAVAGVRYLPWVAIAPTSDAKGLPMFEGRTAGAAATAYYCQDMVCRLPVTSPEELAAQLEGAYKDGQ